MREQLMVSLPDGELIRVDRDTESREVFSAGEIVETPRGVACDQVWIRVVPDDDSNDWQAEVTFGGREYEGTLSLPLGPRFMNEDADEYDPAPYAERLAGVVLSIMRDLRAFRAAVDEEEDQPAPWDGGDL